MAHPTLQRLLLVVASLACQLATAAGPTFRLHSINPESTHNSCAVIDVNHDGQLDIVSGAWWYEAPTWKKHFVREVQQIRGRFDDYSHLPLDVNGDGWVDFISANYRSQSIYWVEHPGKSLGEWQTHVIDRPGAMETGRLADIDGDGQLDLLPNGLKFAAWWELIRESGKHRWQRHDLPTEIAGHGVGFGDLNGDGRGDIVGPQGWLAGPADPRRDRWVYHRDFTLDRDCSIPILVLDVDRDGDNDIVWGRGHTIGLYWLEQQREVGESTRWVRHAIDTSWSQPHSILLADIDLDGREDLVAAKRYMGHDGKDPGEFDPRVAYWYSFSPATRVWTRQTISSDSPAGFGLDPKAADLDGDGDVDLVFADRDGLCWFENLLRGPSTTPTPGSVPEYVRHDRVLTYRDREGELRDVESAGDLAIRRAHILAGMQRVMGPLPSSARRIPLDVVTLGEESTEHYTRRKITFAAEPGDRVPAYLLIPKNLEAATPAMLCLHQTQAAGKDEPAGLQGKPSLAYAQELAVRGYVCIVPDYPSFGEYDYDFSQNSQHRSGSMKAIWNNIRAIDVLETLPEVDRDNIGCIGHSLGGHNGLFTAVFDQRLRAVVTSCGFTAFHSYYGGDLKGWTSARYMPRIRSEFGSDPDRVPFDFYEVIAALAPRGVFINAPQRDSNFDVAGVKKVVAEAKQAFAIRQAAPQLVAHYPDAGHEFPYEVREACYEWLDKQLGR